MMPTRPFRELVEQMSPEAQHEVQAGTRRLKLELRLEDLRSLVERQLAHVRLGQVPDERVAKQLEQTEAALALLDE
jgi:hypothetical protein